jgi:hypothetical protein
VVRRAKRWRFATRFTANIIDKLAKLVHNICAAFMATFIELLLVKTSFVAMQIERASGPQNYGLNLYSLAVLETLTS